MAEVQFTELGAVIRRLDDGTCEITTAEGRRWVFPPNPVSDPAPSSGSGVAAGVRDCTGDG